MCVPSVPPPGSGCQPVEPPLVTQAEADAAAAIAGFPVSLTPAGGRDARTEREHTSAQWYREQQWGDAAGRINSVELGPMRTPGWTDRRAASRVQRLKLPDRYRTIAQRQAAVAASCGAGVRAFRGWEPGPGNGSELRQVVQMHCGTRRCEHCQAELRRRACGRMAVQASIFLTFTTPVDIFGLVESWEECHPSLRQFVAILRRENAYRNREITGARKCDRTRKRNRRSLARGRMQGPAEFSYAWAKEPHQSGRPHVHMILSCTWIDFAWVREVWARVNGAMDANMDGRKVKSIDGACHYLTTYVAKQNTPPDILAIVKAKRLWASTKPLEKKDEIKWTLEVGTSEKRARDSVDNRSVWGRADGWISECGRDGTYAVWRRPVLHPGPVNLEQMWSEPPSKFRFDDTGRIEVVSPPHCYWDSSIYSESSRDLSELGKKRANVKIGS